MRDHIFIPDTQVKPGSCVNHLNALGNYIVDRQPEVLVMAGDWADMHSLSSYDQGRRSGEGARYEADIQASKQAMAALMEPILYYNSKQRYNKKQQYKPEMHLALGNHENRINRHVDAYPVLEGRVSTNDLAFEQWGWKVHDFLTVVEVDGVLYSHFFPRNASGRVMQSNRGAPSASAQVRREFQSCSSGHLQGLEFYVHTTNTRLMYGIIAGSFYMDDYDYLTPQGTAYWRGIIHKRSVHDGMYSPTFVDMDYLLREFWDGRERRV